MIIFKHVSKRYPSGHEALRQVSFHLEEGAMAFLTGHSGAGKSSLLKLVALIERPTQGQIMIDGLHLQNVARDQIPLLRRSMGLIFQSPKLLYDRTIFDNVGLRLVIEGYRHQDIQRRVRAA